MFGVNGWEIVLLALIAVFVLGPDRLPEYAAKLAHGIRRLRVMAEGAKDQLKDQLGPEYEDINWRQYDPRQYDPRRIVKEALLDPLDEAIAPVRGEIDSVRTAAGRKGAAVDGGGRGRRGCRRHGGRSRGRDEPSLGEPAVTCRRPQPLGPGPPAPCDPTPPDPGADRTSAGPARRQRPAGVRPSERPARPRAREPRPLAMPRSATAAGESGPGGQNVNKVSTAVELRFDVQLVAAG